MASSNKRPIRIAGCSGSASDRRDALQILTANHPNDPLDAIIGDWLSEFNMSARGLSKHSDPSAPAYEPTFLESLAPALKSISQHKIKLVVNAGASDTQTLHSEVVRMCQKQGVRLNVAWISGDECTEAVQAAIDNGSAFTNIHTNEKLADWRHRPVYAQAYLGGLGIAAALGAGADIVLCGRASDASLTIGCAAWWHGWTRRHAEQLANALVAGHLIECSSYVTGGNFSGFQSLSSATYTDLGYPIAEVSSEGQVLIAKSKKPQGGMVSVDTCTSQLLYEIQGPLYLNSDVVADISAISFEQRGADRVALCGVRALPPPPTTKVGITARGGYMAEASWYLTGLGTTEKAAMLEAQIRKLLQPHSNDFSHLSFQLLGPSVAPPDPKTQDAATSVLRIVAQASTAEALSPSKFARPAVDAIMQAYPGATPNLDMRTALPRLVQEYWATLLPQTSLSHVAHIPFSSGQTEILIPPPSSHETRSYASRQQDSDGTSGDDAKQKGLLARARGGITDAAGGWAELPALPGRLTLRETFNNWGRTLRGPLGWLVHARSGDKGSDCNVGFWVPGTAQMKREQYAWLKQLLTTPRVQGLLGLKEGKKKGHDGEWKRVDVRRHELHGLRAVHFLLGDYLDRGAGVNASTDVLGKGVAEWLRARHVDLPVRFLEKGRL